jgi:hypothetical protein
MDADTHLRRFDNALEAHLARARLAERGIPAFVDGEATGTAWGIPIGTEDGIRLLVRRDDFDAAEACLAGASVEPREATAAELSELDARSEEDSVEVASPDENAHLDPILRADAWAWRMRAFAVVLFPISYVGGGVLTLLLVLLIPFLLLSPRARAVSPVGRRYLRHAWIVIGMWGAAVAVIAGALWFGRG